MGFRLVSKSVILNDLERRNDRYFTFSPPNSVPVGADYVKTVELKDRGEGEGKGKEIGMSGKGEKDREGAGAGAGRLASAED